MVFWAASIEKKRKELSIKRRMPEAIRRSSYQIFNERLRNSQALD
jgi:urease gamma subunit